MQVVPLVMSSILLAWVVFSVFGPDRSVGTVAQEVFLASVLCFTKMLLHIFAGMWLWSQYTTDNPEGRWIITQPRISPHALPTIVLFACWSEGAHEALRRAHSKVVQDLPGLLLLLVG